MKGEQSNAFQSYYFNKEKRIEYGIRIHRLKDMLDIAETVTGFAHYTHNGSRVAGIYVLHTR